MTSTTPATTAPGWAKIRAFRLESAWAVPTVVALLGVVLDIRGMITGASGLIRYSVVLLVLVAAIPLREPGRDGTKAIRVVAGALFAYGLAGTLYGRFYGGVQDGALPLIVPLALCLLGPLRPPVSEESTLLGLKAIAAFGGLFAFLSAAASAGLIDVPIHHEKSFIIVLWIGCALAARSRPLIALTVTGALLVWVDYPAATYVASAGAGVGTWVFARKGRDKGARRVSAVAAMAGALYAVLHIDDLIVWTAPYFVAVGKTDNGSTREGLYSLALARVRESPWVSTRFTGDLSITTTLSGRSGADLPIHNDYLSIAVGGGFLATGLLLCLFALVNGLALKTLSGEVAAVQRRAILALLASMNAMAIAAAANPVLINPGTSVAAYAIILGIMTLCAGAREEIDLRTPGRERPVPREGRSPEFASSPRPSPQPKPWHGSRV